MHVSEEYIGEITVHLSHLHKWIIYKLKLIKKRKKRKRWSKTTNETEKERNVCHWDTIQVSWVRNCEDRDQQATLHGHQGDSEMRRHLDDTWAKSQQETASSSSPLQGNIKAKNFTLWRWWQWLAEERHAGRRDTCPRCSEYLCPRRNKACTWEGAFQTHVAGQLLFLDIWKRPFRAFSHLRWVKAMNLTNVLFYLCGSPSCSNRKRTEFFFTPLLLLPTPSCSCKPRGT